MTLLERLKPEYKDRNWSFNSLKTKLNSITNIGDLTLYDVFMMESEFSISAKDLSNIFNLFEV